MAELKNLKITSTKAGVYRCRWNDGWDFAVIYIDDETGTLAISSSYGNWSFTWGTRHLGVPTLHQFLCRPTDAGYVASKLIPAGRDRIASFTETKKQLIRSLLEDRRRGGMDPKKARTRYDELKDWDEDAEHEPAHWTWPQFLHDCYFECIAEEPTREYRAYTETIHALVLRCAEMGTKKLAESGGGDADALAVRAFLMRGMCRPENRESCNHCKEKLEALSAFDRMVEAFDEDRDARDARDAVVKAAVCEAQVRARIRVLSHALEADRWPEGDKRWDARLDACNEREAAIETIRDATDRLIAIRARRGMTEQEAQAS